MNIRFVSLCSIIFLLTSFVNATSFAAVPCQSDGDCKATQPTSTPYCQDSGFCGGGNCNGPSDTASCPIGYICSLDSNNLYICQVNGSGSAEDSATTSAMCNAYKIATGNIGRGVAVFSVVALGIFFFMGKVSWTLALATALGVGALFGAPSISGMLTGRSFTCS